mmetsp:Transcript_11665/g.22082  ORF Transcript_11665/g.22082 Transcript_11665/m.22082 type:complete len:279 (-) Transcript_11665:340-1176(-)
MRGAEEDGGALQGRGDEWRRGDAEASGEGHDDGPHDGAPRRRQSNCHGISSLAPVRVHRLRGQRSLRRPLDAGRYRHGPSLRDHGIGRRRHASPPPSPAPAASTAAAASSCSFRPGKWDDFEFGPLPLRGRATAAAARSGSGDHDGNASQPRRSAAADGSADAASVRWHATSGAAERCSSTATAAAATPGTRQRFAGRAADATPGNAGTGTVRCTVLRAEQHADNAAHGSYQCQCSTRAHDNVPASDHGGRDAILRYASSVRSSSQSAPQSGRVVVLS